MTELSTANSFIVRVYRVDADDPSRLTGLVEAMDGSGERTAFSGSDELTAVLNRCCRKTHTSKKNKNNCRSVH